MGIGTPSVLTNGSSGTDATAYTTASISPAGDSRIFLFVSNGHATAGQAVQPTLGGTLGVTWALVGSQVSSANTIRGTLWVATIPPGSSLSGTIAINFSTAQSNCEWTVAQIANAGAVQQFKTLQTSGTNPSLTLDAALQSGSLVLGYVVRNLSTAFTQGANFTLLASTTSQTAPVCAHDVEYDPPAATTTVNWVTASATVKALFGAEILFAPFLRDAADTAAATDAVGRTSTRSRAAADSAAGTDALARTSTRARAAADTAASSDAVARSATQARGIGDTAAASDTLARSLVIPRTKLADVSGVTDAVVRSVAEPRAVADAAAAGDAVVRAALAPSRATGDDAAATDAVASTLAQARPVADAATATDVVAATVTRTRSLGDDAPVADALDRSVSLAGTAGDSAPADDALASTLALSSSVTDAAPVDDAVTAAHAYTRTVDDDAQAVDLVQALAEGEQLRVVTDSAPAVSSVTRTASTRHAAADTAPAGDAVARTIGKAASLADTAAASDAVVSRITRARVVDDTTTLADLLTAATTQARSVLDAAPAVSSVAVVAGAGHPVDDPMLTLDPYAAALRVDAPAVWVRLDPAAPTLDVDRPETGLLVDTGAAALTLTGAG